MAGKNLSDAQLEARLERFEAKATEHQRAGGASRGTAILFTILGFIGFYASLQLIMAEKTKLKNPETMLQCDLNPLIGCGKWIGAWQNEVLFGISNSVLGFAFFSGVIALGLVLLTDGRFGKWLWRALAVGTVLGLVWVLWFGYQSYVVERSMCPYCVIVWFTFIPLFVHVWARTLQAGHWGEGGEAIGSSLVRNRWIITGIIWVALILFTVLWFWNQWFLVF